MPTIMYNILLLLKKREREATQPKLFLPTTEKRRAAFVDFHR